jgi:hypothetical protein
MRQPLAIRQVLVIGVPVLICVWTIAVLESAPQLAPGTVAVALPLEAAAATCSVVDNGRVVARYSGKTFTVQCPGSAQESLSCDGPGLEPVDTLVADVCRNSRVSISQARDVMVEVGDPSKLALEWLRLSASGLVTVTARRSTVLGGALRVSVAALAQRLIRFARVGASPVTISANDLLANTTWTLPAPEPGGELFGVVDAAQVLPTKYRLLGPSAKDLDRAGRYSIAIQGLQPGVYSLEPVYEGGLTGQPVPVTIQSEQSTTIVLRPALVGAALITADPAVCAIGTEFLLERILAPEDAAGITRELTTRTVEVAGCKWTIGGLVTGSYQASLRVATGSGGSQEFKIAPQQIRSVTIVAPTVVVSGRVTINDVPAADKVVEFTRDGGNGFVRAITDEGGSYALTLDRSGEYLAVLYDGTLLPRRRSMQLSEGFNTLDWSIADSATALIIQVSGMRGEVETSVDVRSDAPTRIFASKSLNGDAREVVFGGLPIGEYYVSAHQGSLTSGTHVVAIDSDTRRAKVDLTLDENLSVLTLSDEIGNVIREAHFRVFPNSIPNETGPGIYSLIGVPPGSQLRVQGGAGLVPICRLVPKNGDVDVVFRKGRPVILEFPTSNMNQVDATSGSLLETDGSDCPVPLLDFQASLMSTQGPKGSSFAVQNFPTDNQVILLIGGRRRPVVVDERGVVRVR